MILPGKPKSLFGLLASCVGSCVHHILHERNHGDPGVNAIVYELSIIPHNAKEFILMGVMVFYPTLTKLGRSQHFVPKIRRHLIFGTESENDFAYCSPREANRAFATGRVGDFYHDVISLYYMLNRVTYQKWISYAGTPALP